MSVFIGYASFMAYQMMKGNNDGFPSIPGMIARYSALGLTNEEMSKNPVWVDKTGNGHDLQMKNLAWGGMSGVGGYADNWNSSADWAINSYWVNSHTDHKLQFITASTVVQVKSKNIYNAENVYKNILKVNGLTEAVNKGAVMGLGISATDSITSEEIKTFSFDTDGVIQISFDDVLQDYYVNYFVNGNNTNDIDITIEQLPLYPGALVFDGVGDHGTCDNFPILTKEKGYTVVALRQYLVEKSTAYLTANGDSIPNTSFIFEGNNYTDTWNFGKPTTIRASRILATQTSKQYDGVKLKIGSNTGGSNLLQVGKWNKSYSNAAIWELVFLDHDATEEELTKIKDYFVKTYPWLFPNQAWTVTGKTNEDEDRATIVNITGNGNDLVLSNFGFAEGSGYNEEGEYAGYLVTDGVDDKIVSSTFKLGKDFTVVGEWEFLQDINNNSGSRKTSSFIIRNNASGLSLIINRTSQPTAVFNVKSLKAFCSNGLLVKNDWTEQIDDTVSQIVTSSNSELSIACRDDGVTEYDKFAFKNLAIYPMVLSKDDCIKAYNYLQTLKAK